MLGEDFMLQHNERLSWL